MCEPHDSTGEPGAGNRPAGFGERGEETCPWESDCGPAAKAPDEPPNPTGYAPPLDSTRIWSVPFLGHLSSVQELDGDRILAEMNRLLPLYEYVKSKGRRQRLSKLDEEPFVFRPGCTSKAAATKASYAQQELDANLRHNLLQDALYRRLVKKHGAENVGTESSTGIGTRVDLVVRQPNGYSFYEIKTSLQPRACMREAIGQLLEGGYPLDSGTPNIWCPTKKAP